MTVSIKQLKAFVAVVEEKSFSQAAERLNATQSGMSMFCLLYTSPSPRDISGSRMPSSA